MKKYTFLMLILFSGMIAHAQLEPGFTIGPKVGATFSKFSSDQAQMNEELKSSFHFGAFARFGESLYFQPELNIMSRSGKFQEADQKGNIKVTSLDVPLLLGVRVLNMEVLNARVMAGPVASLAVNKKVTMDDLDLGFKKDDLKSVYWGLQFGAGVDLLIFTLDLRYELGLNNLSKLDGFDLKNNMFTLALGIKLM